MRLPVLPPAAHLRREFQWTGATLDREPYAFTCFRLRTSPWDDARVVDRAVQVLANPSTLAAEAAVSRERALETEGNLLHASTPPEELVSFSVPQSHLGWASWSSIGLWMADLDRLDTEHLLVDVEIQTQALWCYAYNVAHYGAELRPNHGAPFLRRALRAMRRPGPTEHLSSRRLREAIVETSFIDRTVSDAIDSVTQEE